MLSVTFCLQLAPNVLLLQHHLPEVISKPESHLELANREAVWN